MTLMAWVRSNQGGLFDVIPRRDWTISIWADCGERIKNVLFIARTIQDELRVPVRVNFFCPQHGHSECDGHFAHGKKAYQLLSNFLSPASTCELTMLEWLPPEACLQLLQPFQGKLFHSYFPKFSGFQTPLCRFCLLKRYLSWSTAPLLE